MLVETAAPSLEYAVRWRGAVAMAANATVATSAIMVATAIAVRCGVMFVVSPSRRGLRSFRAFVRSFDRTNETNKRNERTNERTNDQTNKQTFFIAPSSDVSSRFLEHKCEGKGTRLPMGAQLLVTQLHARAAHTILAKQSYASKFKQDASNTFSNRSP